VWAKFGFVVGANQSPAPCFVMRANPPHAPCVCLANKAKKMRFVIQMKSGKRATEMKEKEKEVNPDGRPQTYRSDGSLWRVYLEVMRDRHLCCERTKCINE